jgi:ubiquinone/menaquinone biosynthesis C-methylase UbiE
MRSEQPLGEHALRAARTYGAAADHYGLASLGFWDRYGAATVSRLGLAAGDAVLDLCCGAGGSAIPAARVVGASGRVMGVDIAGPLLELARARAASEGLANIEFRQGDASLTGLPGGRFDAVVCVFGVFFAPDMAAFVAEMWRLVRPGGVLAITTWGPGLFEPANGHFWESVRKVEPSLFKAFNPWDEITTPRPLRICSPAPGWRTRSPWLSRASTTSTVRTASGTSCSAPVTGAPSTPSARKNALMCRNASLANCDRATSQPCERTWFSELRKGRDRAPTRVGPRCGCG